jgi:hypothetical protein
MYKGQPERQPPYITWCCRIKDIIEAEAQTAPAITSLWPLMYMKKGLLA